MEEMFENKEKMYNILTKDGRGLTLGKDIILPEDKRGNVNTLIVGGSGAGKSSAYRFKQDAERGLSFAEFCHVRAVWRSGRSL